MSEIFFYTDPLNIEAILIDVTMYSIISKYDLHTLLFFLTFQHLLSKLLISQSYFFGTRKFTLRYQ